MDLRLDMFEGPLDLLLHLIKENKMNILDIEVTVIAEQYLEFINSLSHSEVLIASSYLVMASELIELKAKMLLPRKTKEEKEEEQEQVDNLVNRLLEYQAYKEITKTLKERENNRQEIHTKLPEKVEKYLDENTVVNHDGSIDLLVEAFQKFLARKKEEIPLETKITMKEITVSSREIEIRSILKKQKRVEFSKLFSVATKDYIVATFLAILDMARNKELKIIQRDLFSDIICEVS